MKFTLFVVFDIALEESLECIEYEVVDFGHCYVLAQEGCHRCQEAVCLGFAVYTADDAEQVEVVLVEEAGAYLGRELLFEHIAKE